MVQQCVVVNKSLVLTRRRNWVIHEPPQLQSLCEWKWPVFWGWMHRCARWKKGVQFSVLSSSSFTFVSSLWNLYLSARLFSETRHEARRTKKFGHVEPGARPWLFPGHVRFAQVSHYIMWMDAARKMTEVRPFRGFIYDNSTRFIRKNLIREINYQMDLPAYEKVTSHL